ncbi:MAG: DegV family protein [Rubrobacteridae bacterium]|nr:DegV family protein [Rubrobacteridae bacterium]
MQKIAIVTDSTADLPLTYYEENDVTMVPLTVRFGKESYRDWIEMPPNIFYKRLRDVEELPKTSQPSVQEFFDAYSKYQDYDHIISVHISSKLSGTSQVASIAAQSSPTPVTVIDSKYTSAGLGILIKKLVAARNNNLEFEEMLKEVQKTIDSSTLIFYVDTLHYLELGGRIGKASALAGSILDIKPILMLEDGIVTPLKKLRGKKKALREMISHINEVSAGKNVDVILLKADSDQLLEEMDSGIKGSGVALNSLSLSRIGCVVGTYSGPDAVGIYICPA